MQTNTEPSLTILLDQLNNALAQEVPEALGTLLKDNAHCRIYNIGLYYCAGSWSYCLPTLASEAGLEKVARAYAVHSMLAVDDIKQQLRWSPCDSPHHSDTSLESMMPMTQQVLESLSMYCDELDDYSNDYFDETDTETEQIHNRIHARVINELKKAVTQPAMRDYIQQGGLITLQAGDQSHECFLADVAAIMGEAAHKRVEHEISIASELFAKEYALQQAMTEEQLAQLEATTLSVADFQPDIDRFKPAFVECDGGVYLAKEQYLPAYTDSEQEALYNRFSLWDLLQSSEHFDEIYRKFGGLTGKAPAKEDLLPTIALAFATKLKTLLQNTFPNRRFKVYICVSRMALSRIAFCTERNDGYDFHITTDDVLPGVQTII
ncbi:hypothetical protein [Rheinheimera pleomorphica]|uniref:hypothetical protein n=1 Tax=Rheinheimera pleomorphica TaxID=2703963 RepID=UPI0014233407|nr:hypothetical protein [Rheinheimera pleomorphica]